MILLPIIITITMLLAMFYVIYEVERWRSTRRVLLALYVEGMMLTMNIGGYLYLISNNPFYFLMTNSAYMIFGLYPLLNVKEVKMRRFVYSLFALLMVISEIAMGALIYTLETSIPANIDTSIGNIYFVSVMMVEMAFTLILSFKNIDKTLRNYLIGLLLLMPWFPQIFPSINLPIWLSAIIMIGDTILIYDSLYKQRLRASQETFTTIELTSIFTLMMIGEFLFFLYGTLIVFDISMIIGMTWFVYRALAGPNPRKGNYTRNPLLAFTIIFLTFIMEFFMGGVLDFVEGIFSPGISGFINSLTLPWQLLTNPINALWDLIDIVGSILGSMWFLIMMGIEMGFLAFKKMLEMRVKEVRVRMSLMILAYALYTIYIPTFSPLSDRLPYIPYMWSMGIGTLGGVSNSILIGLIGTYVVYAILSFLFGSRNLCSVSCTAPLMYQGTFYDSLKVYNRTSKVGRKLMTSRRPNWVKAITLSVSILVLIAAVVSYLNSLGVISFTLFGTDITFLIYFVWFDVIWYLLFISIPFLGTFACVTTGYCYWGVFNQAVSSIGLFRLKIKDPMLCVNCKTVDCAFACPVGITDMRGWFIKKGEFKSFKCVGIGECVDACPYDNIYFYDVRQWMKERFKH
ncbi:MAG: 4Fe-4S binding protein [Saccharolobus sp.]|uniref:4Fe-4S binding protein n=3 Tax=Sulfolobaceae TaxID=118883 RepID=UPI001F0D0409|nr:4Fe-4S binding protein [Saccharolobus shibatae]MCH4815700.1 4Fe-4S binding protein [Saccharolobus shibatae]